MRWYHPAAHFLGAMFLVNAVPHLSQGMAGIAFPTPFATPPGEGLSSPMLNVLWALINLGVAYGLLAQVGSLDPRRLADVAAPAVGFTVAAFYIAGHFAAVLG